MLINYNAKPPVPAAGLNPKFALRSVGAGGFPNHRGRLNSQNELDGNILYDLDINSQISAPHYGGNLQVNNQS